MTLTQAPPTPATAAPKPKVALNMRESGLIIALIAIIALFQIFTGGRLLAPDNVASLIQQNAYVMVLAIGMMLIIIMGHIDLSVGSTVAMVGGFFGIFTVSWGLNWVVAALLSLVIGLLVGAWQGFWVAVVGIPAFIVTLAGMLVFRGIAQVIVGQTIAGFPQPFVDIGNSAVPNFLGFSNTPAIGYLDGVSLLLGVLAVISFVTASMRTRRTQISRGIPVESSGLFWGRTVVIVLIVAYFAYLLAKSTGGFPIVLAIVGVLILVFSFLLRNTQFGRNVYAIGGNAKAAALSGVDTKRVTFIVFVISGVLAAVAGLLTTSRAGAAVAAAGQSYELDAIAACFIGGAAVSGGVGKISGAMIGALIMGVLNIGLSILAVDPSWQMAIKGLVLLGAVAFDLFNKRTASSRGV